MTRDDFELSSRQRAEAYWFLANLFASRLEADDIARMAALGEAGEESGLASEIFAACTGLGDPEAGALDLAREHARLFCGISEEYGPPPPYESLWREGQLMGETTVQVARCYVEAGYQPDGGFAPFDHLVEELRFMAALCNAEAEAVGDGAQQLRRRQLHFLDAHLGAWIGAYCERIAGQAQMPLYRALARVTAAVVAQDAADLREPAP